MLDGASPAAAKRPRHAHLADPDAGPPPSGPGEGGGPNLKPYYLTTPIYYANDVPHIGHAYTTIAADVLARWKRLSGVPVHFLTGTDEHGLKIAQAAAAAGVEPPVYLDGVVGKFRALWKTLDIQFDDFIRTSEDRHKKPVQAIFERLLKQGDIYLGGYEGWYCVPDETFLAEGELIEGKCPVCRRPVERVTEESYFLRLSAYEKRLLDYYESHPDFLLPRSRAPEIVQFVKSGLRDISVSRTKVAWGIPVPSNPRHTVYVWIDALSNYITALGYHPDGAGPGFAAWPADVHLVGKEIYRFHAVIWPVMLMALGLPLPRTVFAHGWWTVEGEKMSKSRGNVVDPHKMVEEFGVDAFRYFLLREVPFGADGDFSVGALRGRYNAELANALGNLLNRTLNLLEKNFGGRIPSPVFGPPNIRKEVSEAMESLSFSLALEKIFSLVNDGNKLIDNEAPWKTVKTDPDAASLTLYKALIHLKQAAIYLHPFMPTLTVEMWRQLGEEGDIKVAARDFLTKDILTFSPGQVVRKGQPLFPRKELPKA